MRSFFARSVVVAVYLCACAAPLEATFGFRKPITIDSARVSGVTDHFGFHVLISLQSDSDLQTNVACASGFDIQFRAADASQILPHEIESYDPATGTLVAWVRIPRLSVGTDTVIYIYYGDATVNCSLATPAGVWDPTYIGVWHLAEDPSAPAPQMIDSSINANHGTSGGGMTLTDQVAGKIAGSIDFDGLDDLIDAGSAAILDDPLPLTVSAWIRPRTAGGGAAGNIVAKYGATSAGRWLFEVDNTLPEVDAFEFNKNYSTGAVQRISNNSLVSYGAWQYVVATWTGSELGASVRIFKDGSEVGYQLTSDGTPPPDSDAAYPLIIGNRSTGDYGFDGLVDEVRISRYIRSDDWIQTEFNNQDNPTKDAACTNTGFACIGAQQVPGALFTNVSVASGLDTGGAKDGGVAWGDFNDDGCLDALVNTNDAAFGTRLYMQDNSGACDGTFTDVSACLAPGLANVRERSVIWGDIDNDGFLDFARNTSSPDIEVYLNNGSAASGCGVAWSVFGTAGAPSQILDATSIPFQFNSEGLGWMDYDADGDLDLMSDMDGGIAIFDNTAGVLTYVATPVLPATQAGKSDYASVADIDVDGDVDLLHRSGSPDLYLNDANAGTFSAGTFDEAAANGNKGGVAFCDFDDDGDFDLFWTDAGVNQVWEQTGVGSGSFTALGVPAGIVGDIDGVACGDVDNDSDLDLMLTSDGNDQLFRNDGAFTFTDISPATFGIDDGEGTAFGDYDRDGDVDILINQGTANELWRNNIDTNNYLVIRALHDAGAADRDAIGATIRLLDCGLTAVSGVREVNGGRGHGSQDPAYVHMGLPTGGTPSGPNTQYVAEVRFLGGAVVRKAVTPAGISGGYQLLTIRDTDSDDLLACATAVELVSFEALGGDGAVVLEWETGAEVDNLGFHLYRADSDTGPFERVTTQMIPGLGSSPAGARYSYLDRDVTNGERYFYRLEDIQTNGTVDVHGPVSATPVAGASFENDAMDASFPGLEDGGALPARITFGDPSATSFRLRKRGRRGLDAELRVGGFYATPLEDGSVRLEIPGFVADTVPLPVKRSWIHALADRSARLVSVRASRIEAVTGLRPMALADGEVVMSPSGAVRLGKRAFNANGLVPEEAARIVEEAFQQETKKVLLELAPLRWDTEGQRLLLARTIRARLRFRGDIPGHEETRRHHVEDESHERRRVIARLSTVEQGPHVVDFEDVFPGRRRSVPTSRLSLSRKGESVAYHVEPNRRRFGRGAKLYFVSDGASANPYGNEVVYELELGAAGVKMDVVPPPSSTSAVPFYWQRVEQEQNLLYMSTLVDAEDPWLWDAIFSGSRVSYSFGVDRMASAVDPARLNVRLQGGTDYQASPDHHVRLWLNGVQVGEESWNAKRPRQLQAEIPVGVVRDGTNVLEVENVGDTEAAFSMVLVDRWALEYPRVLEAVEGRLEGRFEHAGSVSVVNIESDGVVLDVTDERPRWVRPAAAETLSFEAQSNRRYLAASPRTVSKARVFVPGTSVLKSPFYQADYLVIGPRTFLATAEPLLAHRQSQGLTVRWVALEEIYAEFGFGEASPTAIQSFLSYAYHHWQRPSPRYVLLLGDGTYDFKDYLGASGEHRKLPPLLVKTRFMWTASDPAYAAVNGEDYIPDLAIGRLPASSRSELAAMVQKILAYETSGATGLGGSIVLVADDPDHTGDFEADARALASTVLQHREVDEIFLRQLGTDEARARVLESFDRGASILSYLGHGGIDLWADEALLRTSSLGALSPQPRQPVVLTMNCLNGYFHFPFFDSLSEALLKAEEKGAIATFSPSGLSLHEPARLLHQALMQELISGNHARLGDAVLAGQTAFAETGSLSELLGIYHLFGDPALLLLEK